MNSKISHSFVELNKLIGCQFNSKFVMCGDK
jgi:hypothetical protein